MSRILVNPDQVADTAAMLAGTAGEYQLIGTRAASCDCGCMPADVAAVVDAVIADVRSALAHISVAMSLEASDLGWRASVDQNGPSTAISAAWGDAAVSQSPSTMMVGGFDASPFSSSTGGTTLMIGGFGGSIFTTPVGASTMSIGGSQGLYFGGDGGGSPIVIGGTDLDFGSTHSGGGFVIGGTNFDFGGTSGGTPILIAGPTYDSPSTLGPTGDPFWDDPEGWLTGLRPASQRLAESGFVVNIPGLSLANIAGQLGNVTLNAIDTGPGEYRWDNLSGSNYYRMPGELIGTRV